MTTTTLGHLPAAKSSPRKALNVTLWIVQALLALAFLFVSLAKLTGKPDMVALFAAIGIGQWFRYVTGILELTAAVLIVVPKTRSLGAGLLIPIMLGAITANLLLHASVVPPVLLLGLASFVVWGRRKELASFVRVG